MIRRVGRSVALRTVSYRPMTALIQPTRLRLAAASGHLAASSDASAAPLADPDQELHQSARGEGRGGFGDSQQHQDALDELEALLLGDDIESAIADDTANMITPPSVTATSPSSSSSVGAVKLAPSLPPKVFDAEATMSLIEAFLPSDGGVPLAFVTPCVDMEAVSKLHGSLLRFLKRYSPARIIVAQDLDGRWVIRRKGARAFAAPSAAPPAAPPAPEPLQVPPNRARSAQQTSGRLVALQPVTSPERLEKISMTVIEILRDVLKDKKYCRSREALASLPQDVQQQVRHEFGSIPRLVKSSAAAQLVFDLSADSAWLGLKGSLATALGVALYRPGAAVTGLAVPAEPGYAEDAWLVEIDVDYGQPGDAEEMGPQRGLPLNSPKRLATEDGHGVGEGEEAVAAFELEGIPPPPAFSALIPPAPPPPSAHASMATEIATSQRVALATPPRLVAPAVNKKLTVEMKQHELAVSRGWRTPTEMLDMFIDVVPTFHVPIANVRVTEGLQKVLGPRHTLPKLFRVYAYFFDIDHVVQSVRIRESVEHPRKGAADKLYSVAAMPQERTAEGGASQASPSRSLKASDVTKQFPVVAAAHKVVPGSACTDEGRSSATSAAPSFSSDGCGPASTVDVGAFLAQHGDVISCSRWQQIAVLGPSQISENVGVLRLHQQWFELRGGSSVLPWEFRLRPFWIAPNASADFDSQSPSESCIQLLVAELEMKMKPVWQLVSKIEKSLSDSGRTILRDFTARRRLDSLTDGLCDVMREHGGSFWLEPSKGRARRLTGNNDLDDDVNELSFVMLRESLLRHHGVEFVRLEDAISGTMLPRAVAHQFSEAVDDSSISGGEDGRVKGFRWRTQKEIHAALAQRGKHFDTKVSGSSMLVAKRSVFRPTAKAAAQPIKHGSSWAKFC